MARRRIAKSRARTCASDSELDFDTDVDADVTLRVRSFRVASRARCFAVYASSDDVRQCADVIKNVAAPATRRFESRAGVVDREASSRRAALQQLYAIVCSHDFRSAANDDARDLRLLRDVNAHLQQVWRNRISCFFTARTLVWIY